MKKNGNLDERKLHSFRVGERNENFLTSDTVIANNSDPSLENHKLSSRNFVPKIVYFSRCKAKSAQPYLGPGSSKEIPTKINSIQKNNLFVSTKNNSHLFEGVKKNKSVKNFDILNSEDQSSIINEIKTASGCTNFQRKIKSNYQYANIYLFPIIHNDLLSLMKDEFGNYLCQDLVGVLYQHNFDYFLNVVNENFIEISFSVFGSKVVQRLIQQTQVKGTTNTVRIYDLLCSKVKGRVVKMSANQNATHIIQKMIVLFPHSYNTFLYKEIVENFLSISTLKYGCFVVEKCILFGENSQRNEIINKIFENISILISDKFGNFICQCLIGIDENWIISNMYKLLSEKIINLCKEKYSSPVLERLFDSKNKALINKIAKSILSQDSRIVDLALNKYGNYIIQKILCSITNKKLIAKIISVIRENKEKIIKKPFGKKVFENIMPFQDFVQ